MSLWFHMQGAGRLLTRRKGPVVRMIFVAFIGTVWCLSGAVWGVAVWRDLDRRAMEMSVDVIGPNDSLDVAIRAMAADMRKRPSIIGVRLMSGDAVWREFAHDMRLEADDLREVASVPTILRLNLRPNMVSLAATDRFVRSLKDIYPEATSSIVWPRAYVEMLDSGRRDVIVFGGVAGILSLILFFLSVTYAFRAEIHRAGSDLRVAALLGASTSWIAAPHLIVGLVAGAIGLALGSGVVLLARPYALQHAAWLQTVRITEIVAWTSFVVIAGIALSWWQSAISVRGATRRQ
ncbi:MAG: hypothetical protein IPI24_00805 [Ignavibacteria bacterium]|nr:hypothetical protein [Ignavibacteria bacterium]MBK6419162.1 hypothetical protein [Ignavibacteria bacterium]MBK6760148.1 hypothetical protein [Ignavibacteria bacterium]MBK7034113.1 hypothetical protein [Ignavibacteria bacterium]MBK7412065.1 hypothetical protein [Ignavibacteria bacterium]